MRWLFLFVFVATSASSDGQTASWGYLRADCFASLEDDYLPLPTSTFSVPSGLSWYEFEGFFYLEADVGAITEAQCQEVCEQSSECGGFQYDEEYVDCLFWDFSGCCPVGDYSLSAPKQFFRNEEAGCSGITSALGWVGDTSSGDVDACNSGQQITDSSGTIDFVWVQDYENNLDCTWSFSTEASAAGVEITWSSFETEFNYDFVTVQTCSTSSLCSVIARFSGSSLPLDNTYTATLGGFITIRFSSDTSYTFEGFSLEYSTSAASGGGGNDGGASETACLDGENVQGSSGQITFTPSGGYANNLRCAWDLVESSTSTEVNIDFLSFSTEATYDFVYIRQCSPSSTCIILAAYHGDSTPPTATFVAPAGVFIRVEFSSDESVSSIGFALQFSVTNILEAPSPSTGADASTWASYTGGCSAAVGGDVLRDPQSRFSIPFPFTWWPAPWSTTVFWLTKDSGTLTAQECQQICEQDADCGGFEYDDVHCSERLGRSVCCLFWDYSGCCYPDDYNPNEKTQFYRYDDGCPGVEFREGYVPAVINSCVSCEPGDYNYGCTGSNEGTCQPCVAGTFKSVAGPQECAPCESCAPSLFRSGCGGSNPGICESCTPGTYKTFTGAGPCTSCPDCPAGRQRSGCGGSTSGFCETCPYGTFKAVDGPQPCSPCQPCPAGQFRAGCAGESSGTCVACASDTYRSGTEFGPCLSCANRATLCDSGTTLQECGGASAGFCGIDCVDCPAGEECSAGGSCAACGAGTFKTVGGTERCTLCESCPAGEERTSCGGSSSGNCVECPIGSYKDVAGPDKCHSCGLCPTGSVRFNCGGSSEGSCQDCGDGSYLSSAGECQACGSCPAGEERVDCQGSSMGSCTPCPLGTYKTAAGTGACVPCEGCGAGEYRSQCVGASAGSCIQCEEGTFKTESTGQVCSPCRQQCRHGLVETQGCTPTLDRVCECTEGCCELQLSSSSSDASWLPFYGERFVQLDAIVEDLPETSDQCHEAIAFLENSDDDVASTSRLYEYCATSFCREKDITIMSGAGWFGLGLEGAVDVCLGSASAMSTEDEAFCNSDRSICQIEQATGDVVNAMTDVTIASLVKQSSLLELVEDAREAALDPENQELLQDATPSQMPGVILSLYSDVLSSFASQEDVHAQALEDLTTAFELVDSSFQQYFDNFIASLDTCNKMIPRTSNQRYLIYDVCSVQSAQCIEQEEAQHVSCCCAYNPLAQLDGLSLVQTVNTATCTFFDICAENRMSANDYGQRVQDLITSSVFSDFVANMEDKYGASFSSPDISTSSSNFVPEQAATPFPYKEASDGQGQSCETSKRMHQFVADAPEELVELRDPRSNYRNLEMVYDFEGPVDENWCEAQFGNEDGPLFDRCSAFCGAGSVPMLVGSPKSGVNAGQALGVCFHPDVVGSSEEEQFCAGDGREAFITLQDKVADLVARLTTFKTAQILFVTMLDEVSELIKDRADSDELKDEIRRQNSDPDRVEVYKDFYRQQFEVLENSEQQLVEIGRFVKDAFEEVKEVFDTSMENLRRYIGTCSQGFPRTTGNQAMLAICPVSGNVCPDNSLGDYVFCCCSANKILDNDETLDVCAEAKDRSASEFEEIALAILSLQSNRRDGDNQPDGYFGKFLDGMETRYEGFYEPPIDLSSLSVGGSTNGGNGGSTDGNGGSTDGNGGSTDGNGGSTDGNGGSTDGNGGSTDGNGGSTDGNDGGSIINGGSIDSSSSAAPLRGGWLLVLSLVAVWGLA